MVLSAGVATAALGASLGMRVPVGPSSCPLFRLRAPTGLVRTAVKTQDFDLRHVAVDRLIAAADSPERTLAAIGSTFRGAGSVELLSARLGTRPMPAEPMVARRVRPGQVAGVPALMGPVVEPDEPLRVVLAARLPRLLRSAWMVEDGSIVGLRFTHCGDGSQFSGRYT
ncbi:hypothetical protein [Amycolatopsis sp. NPDC051903]|uniref:hypothetical protein n=1 Tax=Amycolatopsis sp. NPDC051903 TaxID=3363936 RepID=UPI0037A0BF47